MEQLSAIEQVFPANVANAARQGSSELGQEQFLELLVAQLQNQDPSKPVENGEFLTQIAQFSMVTGIGGLEEGFSSLSETLQRNQVADAAGSDAVLPAGGNVSGKLALDRTAGNVQLRVMDLSGATVATVNLGARSPGAADFSWDGATLEGSAAPGNYRFAATGLVDGVEQSLPLRFYDRVESVSIDPVSRQLALQGSSGAQHSLSSIHEFK